MKGWEHGGRKPSSFQKLTCRGSQQVLKATLIFIKLTGFQTAKLLNLSVQEFDENQSEFLHAHHMQLHIPHFYVSSHFGGWWFGPNTGVLPILLESISPVTWFPQILHTISCFPQLSRAPATYQNKTKTISSSSMQQWYSGAYRFSEFHYYTTKN